MKAEGATDRAVSAQTGVPVTTIRAWRNHGLPLSARRQLEPEAFCRRCGGAPHEFDRLPATTYAYLLGLYLGDGYLSRAATSWTLRVALDAAYPNIVAECCEAIEAFTGRRPRPRIEARCMQCVRVDSTWKSWECLFPQHGPGRKHHRTIALVPGQQHILKRESPAFLRGLIHSDGWRGVNRVHVKGRDYAYPRYQFPNRSDDIRRLFTDACDRLGVQWRQWTRYHVSIARRDSVARLDSFIGPKS